MPSTPPPWATLEQWRLTRDLTLYQSRAKTEWGTAPVSDICVNPFGSVAVNAENGLVKCAASDDQTLRHATDDTWFALGN